MVNAKICDKDTKHRSLPVDDIVTVTGLGCAERKDIGSSELPHHGGVGTNVMFSKVNSRVPLVTFSHFCLQKD